MSDEWVIPTDITIGGQKFWVYPSSRLCYQGLLNTRRIVFLEVAVMERKDLNASTWKRPKELGPGGSAEYCVFVLQHRGDIPANFGECLAIEFDCIPEHSDHTATVLWFESGRCSAEPLDIDCGL